MNPTPRRLIEVDLPLRALLARRDKFTLPAGLTEWEHTGLRVLVCAALWPDPVDEACPQAFRDAAGQVLADFAAQVRTHRKLAEVCARHWPRWNHTDRSCLPVNALEARYDLRNALLDFNADFAPLEADSLAVFWQTARQLTWLAQHESLLPGKSSLEAVPGAGLLETQSLGLGEVFVSQDGVAHLSVADVFVAIHPDSARDADAVQASLVQARERLSMAGVGLLILPHKNAAEWEQQVEALLNAGWVVTGSWPMDAFSLCFVCRPREAASSAAIHSIGDWREVLLELPIRIHAWLPRLASAGVVGAEAVLTCLGPALEIYSRYSRVETARGDVITLRQYFDAVWAAISREALNMIFAGATDLEDDARLTAIWLWTVNSERGEKVPRSGNYHLDLETGQRIVAGFDEAGVALSHLWRTDENGMRLLTVRERGEDWDASLRQSAFAQLDLFAPPAENSAASPNPLDARPFTILDRLHQAMFLFGSERLEALKHFLQEHKLGRTPRFWQLSQALSALYPPGSEEKRWVEGVLAWRGKLKA